MPRFRRACRLAAFGAEALPGPGLGCTGAALASWGSLGAASGVDPSGALWVRAAPACGFAIGSARCSRSSRSTSFTTRASVSWERAWSWSARRCLPWPDLTLSAMAAAQQGLAVGGWYLASAKETRARASELIVTILKGQQKGPRAPIGSPVELRPGVSPRCLST